MRFKFKIKWKEISLFKMCFTWHSIRGLNSFSLLSWIKRRARRGQQRIRVIQHYPSSTCWIAWLRSTRLSLRVVSRSRYQKFFFWRLLEKKKRNEMRHQCIYKVILPPNASAWNCFISIINRLFLRCLFISSPFSERCWNRNEKFK